MTTQEIIDLAGHRAVPAWVMKLVGDALAKERDSKIEMNSTRTVAVDREYYWLPISDCPVGVKVQLLGRGGVAYYGTHNGKDTWPTHWAPLPTLRKEDR